MGNDLETSKALYSASFCINSKERFLICKGNKIFEPKIPLCIKTPFNYIIFC